MGVHSNYQNFQKCQKNALKGGQIYLFFSWYPEKAVYYEGFESLGSISNYSWWHIPWNQSLQICLAFSCIARPTTCNACGIKCLICLKHICIWSSSKPNSSFLQKASPSRAKTVGKRNKCLIWYINWPTGGALCFFTFNALQMALKEDTTGHCGYISVLKPHQLYVIGATF